MNLECISKINQLIADGLYIVIKVNDENEDNYLFTENEMQDRFPDVLDELKEFPLDYLDDVVYGASLLFKKVEDIFELIAFLKGEYNEKESETEESDFYPYLKYEDFPVNSGYSFSCVLQTCMELITRKVIKASVTIELGIFDVKGKECELSQNDVLKALTVRDGISLNGYEVLPVYKDLETMHQVCF